MRNTPASLIKVTSEADEETTRPLSFEPSSRTRSMVVTAARAEATHSSMQTTKEIVFILAKLQGAVRSSNQLYLPQT